MIKFLPFVEKVIEKAKKKKTLTEQLDYIFTNLEGITIKSAKDLTAQQLVAYALFFGLGDPKLVAAPKRARRTQTI